MTWVFTLRALVVQYICQTSLPSDPEGARTLRQLKDLPTPRPYFAVKIDSLKRTGKLFFTLSYIANSLLVCHYCSILSTLQKRGLQHTRNNVAISKLQWNSMIKDTITIKNCHWDETSCFATTTTFPSSFIKIYLKKHFLCHHQRTSNMIMCVLFLYASENIGQTGFSNSMVP